MFIIDFLLLLKNWKMETPTRWGWFHLLWWGVIIVSVTFFIIARKKKWDIKPNLVYGIYGFTTFFLELTKQLIWSVNRSDGVVTWKYQWYAAPYQICTTPMYVAIALCFVKKERLREALQAYLAFFMVLNCFSVMVTPDTCFCGDVLINIHTMFLHAGGLIVGLFVLAFDCARPTAKNHFQGFLVYLFFVITALILNIVVYQSGVLNGETFNMFYISPYFISPLPVFSSLQENLPYLVFLFIYILAFTFGSLVVAGVDRLCPRRKRDGTIES